MKDGKKKTVWILGAGPELSDSSVVRLEGRSPELEAGGAMNDVVEGPCKLCGTVGPLQWSHIMPRWTYRRVGQFGEGDGKVISVDGKRAIFDATQLAAHLLCRACEERFGRWETYVSKIVLQVDESLPALGLLVPIEEVEGLGGARWNSKSWADIGQTGRVDRGRYGKHWLNLATPTGIAPRWTERSGVLPTAMSVGLAQVSHLGSSDPNGNCPEVDGAKRSPTDGNECWPGPGLTPGQ
jgi:hypothetical protein